MSSAYAVFEGTTIRFYTSTPFTSIAGTVVDPDRITFSYQIQGQSTITFTYTQGTGDPTATIVRDSTGTYHADIDTSGKPGVWIYRWTGAPFNGTDTTHTKVAYEGNVVVSGKAF
jgi:hypothetical protein